MANQDMKKSLEAFANSRHPRERRRTCWTCSIPEREVIDEAFRSNSQKDDILTDWLMTERGYGETLDYAQILWRIRNHKYAKHHEGRTGRKPKTVLS